MPKVLISIISPPGGGKSTILRELSRQYDVPLVSSGDIARQMQKDMEEQFILAGSLAPEDEMRKRLFDTIATLFETKDVVLADGFPRFDDQYAWLKGSFPNVSILLYHLDVPTDIIMERLGKRNREDDQQSIVEDRIRVYETYTKPIVGKYNVQDYDHNAIIQAIHAATQKLV